MTSVLAATAFVEILLSAPITDRGETVTSIRLRVPTLDDWHAVRREKPAYRLATMMIVRLSQWKYSAVCKLASDDITEIDRRLLEVVEGRV